MGCYDAGQMGGFDVDELRRVMTIEEEPLVQDLRKLDELIADAGDNPELREHFKIMWERYS
jgi:hypothetical protein